jgi:hypothetical protein
MPSEDDDDFQGPGAVGDGNYVVGPGDCLSSIAKRFGFRWETLWELPENADLRSVRKNPNILLPGDKLTIPDLRKKELDRPSDQHHKFLAKVARAKLVMRFKEDGVARAGERYSLCVDGNWRDGTLDGDGTLTESIPPDAKTGKVILDGVEEIPLNFGMLDPITETSGVQGRLLNLGYSPGPIDGKWGPHTAAALRDFQASQRLRRTGKLDDATRDALVAAHGS